ncbi:glycosyltransferase family 2 protein [Algisphaera agarilytica]|uniref:Glycosyltransferase involved in cell wall biosynthesis n=1 Tax=Algisphaera agarilytica TaxID=1385975 RepID=A0A7X0LKZ8_9BACT|nr:glycosyltransferase family 2 protein [Algisphaera agarilytica]MBB6430472.1 glycosyltransferase involved in cell wall biosynthesis [Algisphaera agarilytica]
MADAQPSSPAPDTPEYDLAVVAPALNEAGNLTPLVQQIAQAFSATGKKFQIVIVDDGSTDTTPDELASLKTEFPMLTTVRHDTPQGQSASMRAAIHAASAPIICTLDADLQNDPADLPRMVELLIAEDADLVQGDRSANRQDHAFRKIASIVGRYARKLIVGDGARDTGCGTRALKAEMARRLPLHRPGMHRFIPACAAGFGGKVVETAVNHRPRHEGKTKYGTGLLKRGIPGLRDCFAVRGMIREAKRNPASASTAATP